MKITVNLNSKSVDSAIKQLQQIKKTLETTITTEYLQESLYWIKERANEYLDDRTYAFPDSANISQYWVIEPISNTRWRLRNTNKIATLVEFGTGMVGGMDEHPLANEENYQYDVNNHGEEGWDFFFYYDGEKYDYKNYTGYKGKSFLYDAVWDFCNLGFREKIFKEVYSRYIK